MKLTHFLAEKSLVPSSVSGEIYNVTARYFGKYSGQEILDNGDELGDKILKIVNERMPQIGLRKVSIFQKNIVENGADCYANVHEGEIVFTKQFLNRGNSFQDLAGFSNHMSELIVHELVHIIQRSRGAFITAEKPLNKETSYWFNRGGNGAAKYDFHSMSTTELQAIGVQIAKTAIHGGSLTHEHKFQDFLNGIMKIDIGGVTVKEALSLRRLDGSSFSTSVPEERKAIKTVYRAFLNVIHDEFYGEGHDEEQQSKFNDDRMIADLKRQAKKRDKEVQYNLLRCKKFLLGDNPFPSYSLFRRIVSFGNNVLESAFMEHLNAEVIRSSVGGKLEVKDGAIVFDGGNLKSVLDQIDLENDNRREVYDKFMHEIYSQIHEMSGAITVWKNE